VSERPDNVMPFSKPQRKPASNGDNGNGYGARLAVVEARLTAVESHLEKVDARLVAVEARLGAVESRLAAVETRLETLAATLATKEDIQSLHTGIEKAKNSMLRWGIGIFVAVLTSVVAALGSVLFMAFRLSSG